MLGISLGSVQSIFKENSFEDYHIMRCGFMGMTHDYITIIQPKLWDPPPEFQTVHSIKCFKW